MATSDDADWVPESLDSMEPGHELACVLSAINVDDCTPYDRIRVLKAQERMRSFYSAQLYQSMTAVVDAVDEDDMITDLVEEAAAAEVAAALKWTRNAADVEMGFAIDIRHRLPAVWWALVEGRIDLRRAKAMIRSTSHLPVETARQVIDEIIAEADRFTTGQLQARLRKLCIDADPDDAARRYDTAVTERRVASQPDESGTAHLYAMDLPPHRLAAGMKRINDLAQTLRRPGETRSIDQLRADVLLDLLEGTGEATRTGRGTVVIHTTLETLTRLTSDAGDLAGYGPVIGDVARQIVEQQHKAEWQWVLNNPETGFPIATGTTRRRPTTQQRRDIEARNPSCIHPGCRMPAQQSDIDHRIQHQHGGPTHPDNLAPLCHHHRLKDETTWNYKAIASGDYEFTTPLGHTYTTSGRSP